MVMVSAIALMADVSVGRQCQLLIQHEGEHISRRERVRLALPSVAPLTTAQHRALRRRGMLEGTKRQHTRLSPQLQTGEKSRCCEAQHLITSHLIKCC